MKFMQHPLLLAVLSTLVLLTPLRAEKIQNVPIPLPTQDAQLAPSQYAMLEAIDANLKNFVEQGYLTAIKETLEGLEPSMSAYKKELVESAWSYAENVKAHKIATINKLKQATISHWPSFFQGCGFFIGAAYGVCQLLNTPISLQTLLCPSTFSQDNLICQQHTVTLLAYYKVREENNLPYPPEQPSWRESLQELEVKWPTIHNIYSHYNTLVNNHNRLIKEKAAMYGLAIASTFFAAYEAAICFEKALTYRHQLAKDITMLDVIINYLKNEIA